jgi:AraC family transcriptional regulator
MQHPLPGFSVAAAQLIEAACRARDGDCETAQAHIAHAIALLDGQPDTLPVRAEPIHSAARPGARLGLTSWQVRRVIAHIDAHLTQRIAIAELAMLLRLSKSHFCREFKSTVGVTAHTWIMRRRVELAQALLLTTDASLSQIALSCGMSDQSHFTRTFRRLVGETPRCWRRSRREAMEGRTASVAPAGVMLAAP